MSEVKSYIIHTFLIFKTTGGKILVIVEEYFIFLPFIISLIVLLNINNEIHHCFKENGLTFLYQNLLLMNIMIQKLDIIITFTLALEKKL